VVGAEKRVESQSFGVLRHIQLVAVRGTLLRFDEDT
jgi:hypothetical protein